jgi:Leucine-rich repeat (LRR) protein
VGAEGGARQHGAAGGGDGGGGEGAGESDGDGEGGDGAVSARSQKYREDAMRRALAVEKRKAKSKAQLDRPPRYSKADACVELGREAEFGRWMSRRRAQLKEVASAANEAGGGVLRADIELMQLGDQFKLVFRGFACSIPPAGCGDLFLYVSLSKAVHTKGDVEQHDLRIDVHGGNGSINGRGAHFEQLLPGRPAGAAAATERYVDPLRIVGIYALKPATTAPRTVEGRVFGVGNISEMDSGIPMTDTTLRVRDDRDAMDQLRSRDLARGDFRKAQKRKNSMAVYQAHAADLAAHAPALEQVRRQAQRGYRALGKDPSTDSASMGEFKRMLDELDIVLLHPRAAELHAAVNLSHSGRIDATEFELALDIANQLPPETKLGPVDAFHTFETKGWVGSERWVHLAEDVGAGGKVEGTIDFLQLEECISALGLTEYVEAEGMPPPRPRARAKLMMLYQYHNVLSEDGSIGIDAFIKIWSELVDPAEQLKLRGVRPVSFIAMPSKRKRRKANAAKLEELVWGAHRQKSEVLRGVMDRCVRRRRKERLAKQAAKREASHLVNREHHADKRQQAVRDKKERARHNKERAEEQKRARQQKELEQKAAAARIERDRKAKQQFHADLEAKAELELAVRRQRGLDKIHMPQQKLREFPEHLYKSKEAHGHLLGCVSMDFDRNLLAELPENNFFYWCESLRRLKLSHNKLTRLPVVELPSLENLQILLINNNSLRSLPSSIGQLRMLLKIDASQNQLTEIPAEIGNLHALKILKLDSNKLQRLPITIGDMHSLQELNLNCNDIWELPDEITLLAALRRFLMSWNKVFELPDDFGELKHLEYFEMFGNKLTVLPHSFCQLKRLDMLMLRENKLHEIGVWIDGLLSLKHCDLSRNAIKEVLPNVGTCLKLQELHLNHNNITDLPRELGRCTSLERLHIHHNRIEVFRDEFAGMRMLKHLDAGFNSIGPTLPAEFGLLNQLITIDLSHNRLEEIPPNVGALKRVEELYLHGNALATIPSSVVDLDHLRKLNLSRNRMTTLLGLPLEDMKGLETLDLSCNRLAALPADFCLGFDSLTDLDLHDNRLRALPMEFNEMYPRLLKVDLDHNPFSDMPNQWCHAWELRDQVRAQRHVHTSTYTVPEALEFVGECELWYQPAVEEWERNGDLYFAGRSALSNFVEAVHEEMPVEEWEARFEHPLEQFFFACREHNVIPKYHALDDDEGKKRGEAVQAGVARRSRQVERVRHEHRAEQERLRTLYEGDLPSQMLDCRAREERYEDAKEMLFQSDVLALRARTGDLREIHDDARARRKAREAKEEAEAILGLKLQVNDRNHTLIQARNRMKRRVGAHTIKGSQSARQQAQPGLISEHAKTAWATAASKSI